MTGSPGTRFGGGFASGRRTRPKRGWYNCSPSIYQRANEGGLRKRRHFCSGIPRMLKGTRRERLDESPAGGEV